MNAQEFHAKHGRKAVDKVREQLNMSLDYWYHIKNGVCGVSPEKAVKLAETSDEVAPGDGMKIIDLLGLRDIPSRLVGTGKEEK